jgi:hypothetical protein
MLTSFVKQLRENFSLAEFKGEEKSFVLKGRLCHLFSSLNFNISAAAALASYMCHAGLLTLTAVDGPPLAWHQFPPTSIVH